MPRSTRILRFACALVVAVLFGCAPPDQPERQTESPPPAPAIAIVNGTVLDGTGAPAIEDGVVLIEGETIAAVGPQSRVSVPSGVRIIDAGGGTVLPGVVDAHAHLPADPVATLRRFAGDGVTSVCSTGSSIGNIARLHEAARQPGAARAFAAGAAVTAPGGYPMVRAVEAGFGVSGAAEARAAVHELADAGADYIKIALQPVDFLNMEESGPLPVFGLEEAQAIVGAATERGLLVRAHVHAEPLLEIALQAGVDTIEHILFALPVGETLETLYDRGQLPSTLAPEIRQRIERMVEGRVILVPTIENETDAVPRFITDYTEEDLAALRAFAFLVVGAFHEAGGMIALGNDWNGFHSVAIGMPLKEMNFLEASGLTPHEVIRAATLNAARVCGQDAMIGSLEPGKLADLIVVAGDPATRLDALDDVRLVMIGGEVLYEIE